MAVEEVAVTRKAATEAGTGAVVEVGTEVVREAGTAAERERTPKNPKKVASIIRKGIVSAELIASSGMMVQMRGTEKVTLITVQDTISKWRWVGRVGRGQVVPPSSHAYSDPDA